MQNQLNQFSFLAILLGLLFTTSVTIAQSCSDNIPPTTQGNFIDNNDGTVSDTVTNLLWKKCSVGQTWNNISNDCDNSATGFGLKDALALGGSIWRLPNIKELFSIMELSCRSPAIDENFFPSTPSEAFWSSSPHSHFSGNFWYAVFGNNGADSFHDSIYAHVRLVSKQGSLH